MQWLTLSVSIFLNYLIISMYFKGTEWTGNVIARNGQIHLFTSNPSSPMQIHYEDAGSKAEILRWVQAFVTEKRLSGALCFDFMEHPISGEIWIVQSRIFIDSQ